MNNLKLKFNKSEKLVGEISLGLFGIMMTALLYPVAMNEADAAQPTHSATVRAVVNAAAVVSVALDVEAEMDIAPTSSGTFASTTAALRVSTNNPEGYSLYLKTMDTTNNMVNTDTTKTDVISPVNGLATASAFTNNTWGYALTKEPVSAITEYAPVPVTDQQVQRETGAAGETYNLAFGAKVDTSLPAGQYENTVQVSVVANPTVISTLSQLTFMQDMTPDICEGTGKITPGNEVSKRLIDSRDGKRYWVAKLADQNCWMTQNLALDLKEGMELTSGDTDLNSKTKWTIVSAGETDKLADYGNYGRETEVEVPEQENSPSNYTTRSWDLGKYAIVTPAHSERCTQEDGDNHAVLAGQTLDRCDNVVNVEDWRPIYEAEESQTWQDYTGYLAVDFAERTYDAHYLVGNWYQWNAATAGSGVPALTTKPEAYGDASLLMDAPDSICAKGWQLPKSGRNHVDGASDIKMPFAREKSFYDLVAAYGYSKETEGIWRLDSGNNISADIVDEKIGGASRNVNQAPISWPHAGLIYPRTGSLQNTGYSGYMWAATAHFNSDAYNANGNSSALTVASSTYRYHGFSVRCVAK